MARCFCGALGQRSCLSWAAFSEELLHRVGQINYSCDYFGVIIFGVIPVGLSSPGGYAGCIRQRLRPEPQRVQAAAGSSASRKAASAAGTRGLGAAPDLVQLIFASFLGTGSSPQLARALAYPAGAPRRKNCIQELGNFGIFGCQSVLGSRIWIPSCLRSGHVAPGAFFLLAGAGQSRACRGSGRFSRHA